MTGHGAEAARSTQERAVTAGGISFGHLAAAWALLFAVLHVYWALGGSELLASSAGPVLAEERPTWFVVLGLWGGSALLLAGAALGLAIARRRAGGAAARPWALLSCLVGAFLLLRGVGVSVVLLTDAGGVASNVGEAQARMSLLLWNPWFVVGGVLFVAAGIQGRRART